MPSYNHRRFIDEAISSVVSQTLENWELIIIDDHSKDESKIVIRNWMGRDSRIRASFHPRNEGFARTIDQGIHMATAKYVSMMASDDMLRRDALQQMTDMLEKNPDYGVAIAEGVVINESGELIGKTTSEICGGRPKLEAGNFFDELINHNFVFCNAFRRELIEKHGILHDEELELANDWLFWLDLAAVCEFVYIAEPLYYYRVHPLNISQSYFRVVPLNGSRSLPKEVLFGKDFMIFPEKVFSRYAKILDERKRRTVLEHAAYWCERSSFEPAKARGAMYRSISMDLMGLESEISRLESEISRLRSELNDIKSSFMYRRMKFLASTIDSLFPDKTRRGEFRRRVTLYLRRDEDPTSSK